MTTAPDTAEIRSVNPATEEVLATFESHDASAVEAVLERAREAFGRWRRTPVEERAAHLRNLASYLREERSRLAALVTAEMGKPVTEAEAEIEKCATACDYYAERGPEFLEARPYASSAAESAVAFRPLGPILAVMPWNFPFWQLVRFAAPALVAGNVGILKHASNVPQCALAAEKMFVESGFPSGVLQTVLIPAADTVRLLDDERIVAVTLTGSERAGSIIASHAGGRLKKSVLELGGSDAFVVLEDADLEAAVEAGVRARFQNSGQSCIAAKRFVVVEAVFDEFCERFVAAAARLEVGDPFCTTTRIGPLARDDLRGALERQIRGSVRDGARVLIGGERQSGRGYYFPPTVVVGVERSMPLAQEEVFGPVAAFLRARDVAEAIGIANDSPFGLGCSVWTRDGSRAESLAAEVEAGMVFVNGIVASDPRLPFGGIKRSGFGRELSDFGILEFVNVQTVWIGPQRLNPR